MADLLEGNDSVGFEDFCDDVYNAIKNHWRSSNPTGNLTGLQPGMIVSDADDNKLYHITDESPAHDEILQATESFDTIPYFLGVDLWSGAYHHIIKAVDEPGLGGRFTIGLDETARTMVICDYGDVDADFGLSVPTNPTLYLMSAVGSINLLRIQFSELFNYGTTFGIHTYSDGQIYKTSCAKSSGMMFLFYNSAGDGLTDTDAEQAYMQINPKIKQTLTAGYIGILLDVTETSTGDASAGAGYNALMDLRVAGTTQFGIQNDGKIMTNQAIPCESGGCVPGTIIHEMPIYDGDGNLLGYIAIYDAL